MMSDDDKLRILICCGIGASSGFVAQKMRRAAKARGWGNVEISARSEAELDENLAGTDVVLLGPHLQYMIDDAKSRGARYGVSVALVPQVMYGIMDGEGILDLAVDIIESGNK